MFDSRNTSDRTSYLLFSLLCIIRKENDSRSSSLGSFVPYDSLASNSLLDLWGDTVVDYLFIFLCTFFFY